MTLSFGRTAVVAALAASTLMVAGCATETRYRPATGQGFNRTGYSERQIEPNRFLVNFAGNSVTSRDTVERYLLFHAAELTLQHGYDHFIAVDRNTDRQSRTYTSGGFGEPGFGYAGFRNTWGPSWRYYGRFGGRSPGWGPWGAWGGGFNTPNVRTIDRYEATAEIVMIKGSPSTENVQAFDARKVIDTVGPSVQLPKQPT